MDVPLDDRDRVLLKSLGSVQRGDGCVMRVLGIGMLLLIVFMAYQGWQDLQRDRFDWTLLVAGILVACFGGLLAKGGTGFLDEAHVFGYGQVVLHLVSLAPDRYLRLQVRYDNSTEKRQVISSKAFLPQHIRHNIFALLLVSAIASIVWLGIEWMMYYSNEVWFGTPELSGFIAPIAFTPALLAFLSYLRTKRRYKVLTVVRGKLAEKLIGQALVGKMRVPHVWYNVDGEVLLVAPEKTIPPIGTPVEATYVERPKGQPPLPVSISTI